MSGLAEAIKQALANGGDLPVTHGVERWVADGMVYTPAAIHAVQRLIRADADQPAPYRRVAPLESWERWRWIAMGLSAGWLDWVNESWHADGVLTAARPGGFEPFYLHPCSAREFEVAARGGVLPDEVLIKVELDKIRHGIEPHVKSSVVLVNRDTTEWREWRVTTDPTAHSMARMRLNGHTARAVFAPYIPPVAGPRYITDAVNYWLSRGANYTEDALEIVLDVMYDEAVIGHQSGVGRYRTSMIGDSCLRKQQLSFLGWPKDQESSFALNRMENGSWGHLAWQAMGLSAGFLSDVEVPYEIPQWHVGGPMDGLCQDGSGFELKTTNSRTFSSVVRDWEPKEAHLFQITTAMIANDLSTYRVVYVNRDDGTWVEIAVPRRADYVLALERQMKTLLDAAEARELLPMYHRDSRSSCRERAGSKFKNCEFATVCATAEFRRHM